MSFLSTLRSLLKLKENQRMRIEANGIALDVRPGIGNITFQVLSQTPEAYEALRVLGHVRDDQTGFTLRSNQYPNYNKKLRRFFVRGTDSSRDDNVVTVPLLNGENPQQAMDALARLIGKVVRPVGDGYEHKTEAKPRPGGTTHVRFAFITREMAQELKLTGKDHYPTVVSWDAGTKPVVTVNRHYNEHIAQVVDVLNKSMEEPIEVEGVINPHRVTPQQARLAIQAVRDLFEDAHRGGYLVAMWRTITGIRGPDFEDQPTDRAANP